MALLPIFGSATKSISDLRTVVTEHFDIIYEPGSEETVSLLYYNCEELYADLVDFFNADPEIHIPVVVTRQYKVLNAYYTPMYANHIVMFDTIGTVGELTNYPQTFLYVFKHELTHAFEFNFRSKGMQFVSNMVGDIVTWSSFLYMYPSLSEGGAVLAESSTGYGRINNSYAMQIVKQAKIENLFPSWLDISGARDTYPSGLLYYNFAAAFLQYLSDTYGYETVSSLYTDFGKFNWFHTTEGIIKKHIGISVNEAWQGFYDSIEIPQELTSADAIPVLNKDVYVENLMAMDNGSIYFYDYLQGKLYRLVKDLSAYEAVLEYETSEAAIDISEYYIVFADIQKGSTCLKIYKRTDSGLKLAKTLKDSDKDVRSGCVINLDGKDYLCVYSNKGQRTYLDLYDMTRYKKVEGKRLELGFGVTIANMCALSNGRVAFIGNYSAQDRIAIVDFKDMSVSLVDNPNNLKFMSLSKAVWQDDEVLSFSYYPKDAQNSNLGRYGELNLTNNTMRLSDSDVSGSMNSPVRIGNKIYFVSRYYEQIKLRTIDISSLSFENDRYIGFESMIDILGPNYVDLDNLYVKYRPMKYFGDGILIPGLALPSGYSNIFLFGVGATWMTMDPTETYLHSIAVGYDTWDIFANYGFNFNKGIVLSADATVTFDVGSDHNIGLYGDIGASFTFDVGKKGSSITVEDILYGSFVSGLNQFSYNNSAAITFNKTIRTGLGHYDAFAFETTVSLSGLNPGASVSIYLPKALWWIDCPGKLTYNIPTTVSFSCDYNPSYFRVAADTNLVLLGYEIQKTIPIIHLYATRAKLDVDFSTSYHSKTQSVGFNLKLNLDVNLVPVIGSYFINTSFNFGISLFTDFVSPPGVSIAFLSDL